MVDAFKQELDELMGVNRNAAVDARLKHEHYSDPAVFLFCKIIGLQVLSSISLSV